MYFVDPKFTKIIYEIDELKNKLAKLIVERDSLIYHVCKNLKIDYMLKIGSLEYKLLKIQNDILISKRKLEIIKDKLSSNEELDFSYVEEKIKLEFSEFEKIENKMLEDIDISIDLSMSDIIDGENLKNLNDIYYKLQLIYNPILNINIEDDEIYKKIEKAYRTGKIKKLEAFAKDVNSELLIDEIETLEKIKKRYETLISENNRILVKIKNTFPYNQKNMLENENLIRRKKTEINDKIYLSESELDNLKKEISIIKN